MGDENLAEEVFEPLFINARTCNLFSCSNTLAVDISFHWKFGDFGNYSVFCRSFCRGDRGDKANCPVNNCHLLQSTVQTDKKASCLLNTKFYFNKRRTCVKYTALASTTLANITHSGSWWSFLGSDKSMSFREQCSHFLYKLKIGWNAHSESSQSGKWKNSPNTFTAEKKRGTAGTTYKQ